MKFETTGRPRVQSDKACLLYDQKTGEICYVHRVVTIEGADETSEEDIERRARKLAKEVDVDLRGLKAMQVDASQIAPGMRYSVNLKSRALVAQEIVAKEVVSKRKVAKKTRGR